MDVVFAEKREEGGFVGAAEEVVLALVDGGLNVVLCGGDGEPFFEHGG